jgi:hypothetical protein
MLLHPEGAARQQGRLDAGRGQRRHAADTRGEGPGAQAGRRECRATGERGGAAHGHPAQAGAPRGAADRWRHHVTGREALFKCRRSHGSRCVRLLRKFTVALHREERSRQQQERIDRRWFVLAENHVRTTSTAGQGGRCWPTCAGACWLASQLKSIEARHRGFG